MASLQQQGQNKPAIPHEKSALKEQGLEASLKQEKNPIKRFFKILGPGLITGASDDDPAGIGTFAITGASLGYRTLWLSLITLPLMAAIQFICAKIGLVTGRGIAGVLREHYSRKILIPVMLGLVVANTINLGVDIGAIGAAINMLVPVPITLVVFPIAMFILFFQIAGSYHVIVKVFKWLTLVLFAYIGAAFLAHPNWGEILHNTVVPQLSFDKTFLAALVAILGTSISPYLFFWQASQEVEEEISMGRKRLWERKGATDSELKYAAWDVNIGMLFSQIIMYFVILTTASTLFQAGKHDIQSATEAAQALKPLAGDAAEILLAVGLIGAGLLAVPILSGSAAYALAESFGWKYGYDRKWHEAKPFYVVLALLTFGGTLVNFLGINPMQALFWTSIINGFLAPPLMVVLMMVSNNKKIMGERVNKRWINLGGWVATVIMFAAAIGLIITSR